MKHFWYIIKRLRPYYKWLYLSILSNVLMSVFTIASIPLFIPFFDLLFNNERSRLAVMKLSENPSLKEYLNYYLSKLLQGHEPKTALLYVIIAFFLSFFFKNIFRYLATFFITPLRNGFIRDLRRDLYYRLVNLPLLYFKDQKKGDLLSRMSMDMQEIENSIMNVFNALITAPLIILGSLAFMLIISPKLTLFVLILLPVTVFLIGGISRKMKQQSSQAQDQLGVLMSILEETLGSIKIIKSFNAVEIFQKKFDAVNDLYYRTLNKLMWRKYLGSPLAEIMGVAVISLLMYYSGILVFENELEPNTFFAFIYAFFSIIEPAKSFSTAYYSFQKGAAALERVESILQLENDIVNNTGDKKLQGFNDKIEFNNVWFRYPENEDYVLKGINFKINKGQKIALIGTSGAGKTTLADLLSRFYDPQKGEILIDGVNIKEIDLQQLRNMIGIVSQDALLFNDSVLNNITLSGGDYDEERLKEAMRISMVDEFVPSVEQAAKMIIGDQGTKLSGGQKQRIAIARAIYKNAPVLVLDEATSSLDSKSEKKVQKALKEMMKNKTSIIIAHRLSTIQEVDLILVLENGEIKESGTPAALMEKKGAYYRFVQLQQI